ncbi:MAG: glycoside hydrolase family 9 protein [Deltaproteobacteria bacterium]|nr:glycoside hydrolase family 9 protein [Deltaproteobacteria bacterium]
MKPRYNLLKKLIIALTISVFLTGCLLPAPDVQTGPSMTEKVYRLPVDKANHVKFHINQVGYDIGRPKVAVIESVEPILEFEIINVADNSVLLKQKCEPVNQFVEWGGGPNYQLADFSKIDSAVTVQIRAGGYVSKDIKIDKNLLFNQTFDSLLGYFLNSRADDPHVVETDSNVPFIGTNRTADVHGGWYDASGDISKYLSHLSYANFMNPQQIPLVVWSLASVFDNAKDSLLNKVRLQKVADEAAWGADYLVRTLDKDGYFYINVFDHWSGDMEMRQVCAFEQKNGMMTGDWQAGMREGAGMAIASLARVSTMAKDGIVSLDGDYKSADYLKAAQKGWDHLKTNNLKYIDNGVENIIDDYTGLMAASELYLATSMAEYRSDARVRFENLEKRVSPKGYFIADDNRRPFWHASDAGLPIMAIARYYQIEDDETWRIRARDVVKKHLSYLVKVTTSVPNPYGYARQSFIAQNSVVDGFFIPHVNESEYWWQGENARLASLSSAVVTAAELVELKDDALYIIYKYSYNQLNWILGDNPFDYSFLKGSGYQNSPQYNELPNYKNHGDLNGGIANGITGSGWDGAGIAFFGAPQMMYKSNDRWRWLEQWLPHSAWFISAVTILSKD